MPEPSSPEGGSGAPPPEINSQQSSATETVGPANVTTVVPEQTTTVGSSTPIPIAETIPGYGQTDLRGLEGRVASLGEEQNLNQKTDLNLDINSKINPSTNNESGVAEDAGVQSEKNVILNPELEKIIGRKTLEAVSRGEKPDHEAIIKDSLVEHLENKIEETTEEIESQQENPLNPEQKKEISKVFGNAFKSNKEEMEDIAKNAVLLARAKSKEIRLKENQNATEEQRTKASETTKKLKDQYDLEIKKIEYTFGRDNPKLMKYLKESPDNPDVLKLLKKEKNKSLIKTILEVLASLALSAGNETVSEVNPASQK